MHKQRVAILISAALGIISIFMPWFDTPLGSLTGIDIENAWILLILICFPIVMTFLNDQSKSLKGGALYGVIITSIIAVLFISFKILEFYLNIGETSFVALGLGIYLYPISGALNMIFSLSFMDTNPSKVNKIPDIEIEKTYKPKYPQVINLKLKDINIIQSVYSKASRDSNHDEMVKLKNKLTKVLNLEVQTSPEIFIKTVLKDYKYYTNS